MAPPPFLGSLCARPCVPFCRAPPLRPCLGPLRGCSWRPRPHRLRGWGGPSALHFRAALPAPKPSHRRARGQVPGPQELSAPPSKLMRIEPRGGLWRWVGIFVLCSVCAPAPGPLFAPALCAFCAPVLRFAVGPGLAPSFGRLLRALALRLALLTFSVRCRTCRPRSHCVRGWSGPYFLRFCLRGLPLDSLPTGLGGRNRGPGVVCSPPPPEPIWIELGGGFGNAPF